MSDRSETGGERPPKPVRPPLHATVLLTPLLLAAFAFMGADFTAITLRPLKVLGIPYPTAMDYAHWIVPGGCGLLWLATRRLWPWGSAIMAVVLCSYLIGRIPGYAPRRTAAIPVRRWLEPGEESTLRLLIHSPVFQSGGADGLRVVVAPTNDLPTRRYLRQIGLLIDGSPSTAP